MLGCGTHNWRNEVKVLTVIVATTLGTFLLPAPLSADELMIYPKGGQSGEQQEKDKFEFYSWAKNESGLDPMAPAPRPSKYNLVPSIDSNHEPDDSVAS
jgi:hypothetical protein